MGCGASQEEVVEAPVEDAPKVEVDPLDALLAQIRSQRAILTENITKLEDSNAHVRYLWSTMIKFKLTMEELAEIRDEESEMDATLQFHIASQDAEDIREATQGLGTDEEKLAKVIVTRLEEMVMQTDQLYRKRYNESLEGIMNKEGKNMLGFITGALSDFGRFCSYRVMPQPRRDALLLRKCVDGMGTDDKALVEILSTRSNSELKAAAEAYAAEFDGESMVERIKSETGGMLSKNYGAWIDVLVEFNRDESGSVADNVEELAGQLYEAGAAKFVGCDEDVFKDILCNANDATCAAIVQAYQETQGRSLFEDVAKKMGGDLEFSVLARITPPLDFLAGRIYSACKGLGTDEQAIARVLGCLPNRQVHALRERYNARYAEEDAPYNDFRALLDAELSGDFLDAIVTMLESNAPKGHWRPSAEYPAEAAAAAADFRDAVTTSYNDFAAIQLGRGALDGPLFLVGQDDAFVFNADAHTPYPPSGPLPPVTVDREYLLEGELPGSVEEAEPLLSALKSCNGRLEQQQAVNEGAIVNFRGQYAENSFRLRELDTLVRQLRDDNAAMLAFCTERDADNVHEAVAGWGTDEDKLVNVLCALSKRQLERVDGVYGEKYGKSLKEEMDSELSDWLGSAAGFKLFMTTLLSAPAEADAEFIQGAMAGLGTDERQLTEIVCTRSNKELAAARAVFLDRYGETAERWVADDTSGPLQRFLLACLRGERREGFADAATAEREATQLSGAGLGAEEGEVDVAAVVAVLAAASAEHLALVSAEFEKVAGKPISEAVRGQLGDDVALALEARAAPKYRYFAQLLDNAWRGLGTDEEATSRVFGRCTKSELRKVGEEYTRLTGVSFRRAIDKETSGLYQRALLTYLFRDALGDSQDDE